MTIRPLLECSRLSFERDDWPVFAGVSFVVEEGDILQITGANGAGKTTLLRMLSTTLSPSEGRILWQGRPLSECLAEYRSDCLYLGHQPGVKTALTPRENLHWLLAVHPRHADRIDHALSQVGLLRHADSPCGSLSAGQLRRVALARLYLSEARLWILDEPFTAIDRAGVGELETLMDNHAARGGAVVVTTHQPLTLSPKQLDLEPYGRCIA